MNGAESLVRTLVDGGVEVCFANPGTSEMHFVAALDRVDGMRCVLGAVRGRGDRRGRRLCAHGRASRPRRCCTSVPASATASPTCTMPARRRRRWSTSSATTRPITASTTRRSTADIEDAARPFSDWVRTSPTRRAVAADGAAAIAAARTPPGQVATLILPADTAWNEAAGPARSPAAAGAAVSDDADRRQPRACCAAASRRCCCSAAPALREQGPRAGGRIAARPARGCWRRPSTARHRARRGAHPVRARSLSGRSGARALAALQAHPAGRQPLSRWRSSPIRASRSGSRPRTARSTCWRAPRTTRAACARMAGRRARRVAQPIAAGRSAIAPAPRRRRTDRRADARHALGGAAARERHRGRRGRYRRARLLPADAQRAAARLAAEHGRLDRHRHAAGDRRGGRLPGPQGGEPRRPTAARCTRCRRCGRRRARTSTSPR